MKCIECGSDAVAICKFCGKAVCKEHVKTNLFISGYSAKMGSWNMEKNAVRIEDAIWCGTCHPDYRMTS